MICTSIGNCSAEECIELLKGLDFAEIRMDSMDLSEEEIEKIFSQPLKLIATCRPPTMNPSERQSVHFSRNSHEFQDEKRKRLLEKAIESGASLVDIEVEAKEQYKNEIISKAKENNCKVIISYHNYEKTPKKAELEHLIKWCKESEADLVKIACMVNSNQDNARLLGLLNDEKPLVIVGMDEKGRITRIVAPLLGSVFTYASLSKGKESAPGQMTKEELEKLIKVLKDV